jgi:DNA-binding LacI/PurR family transcriptional regulator
MNRPYILFVCDGEGFSVAKIVQGVLQECHKSEVGLLWRGFDRIDAARLHARPIGAILWGKVAAIRNLAAVAAGSFPIVSVIGSTLEENIPTVAPDPFSIAFQVATHLIAEGIRNFIFVGGQRNPAARYRADAFERELRRKLGSVRLQFFNGDLEESFWGANTERGEAFIALLKKESRPIGVFAFNDQVAASCLECAHYAGVRVPQEMSIVGVDDHPIFTQMHQPLSSVRIDYQEIGRKAVALLLQLQGKRPRTDLPLHHFVGGELVVRQSSQPRLLGDEQISKALHHLHEHYGDTVTLLELARMTGMSRTSFATRFQRAVGQAPIRYLIKLRLNQAKLLLTESTLTVSEIAYRVGFEDQGYFTRAFKKLCKLTPTDYRQRHGRPAVPRQSY